MISFKKVCKNKREMEICAEFKDYIKVVDEYDEFVARIFDDRKFEIIEYLFSFLIPRAERGRTDPIFKSGRYLEGKNYISGLACFDKLFSIFEKKCKDERTRSYFNLKDNSELFGKYYTDTKLPDESLSRVSKLLPVLFKYQDHIKQDDIYEKFFVGAKASNDADFIIYSQFTKLSEAYHTDSMIRFKNERLKKMKELVCEAFLKANYRSEIKMSVYDILTDKEFNKMLESC